MSHREGILKEVYEQKTALSNSKTSIDAQLKTAKTSFVNLVHSESLKGDVKGAINAKITNHQVPLLTNFTNALAVLLAQYEKTIKQFQSTVSENAVDAIIDTEYLQGLLDGFSGLSMNISVVNRETERIYSSISDIISLTNPDVSTLRHLCQKVYKRGKEFQTQTKQSDIRKTNIGRGVKMTGWKNAWADARKSGAAAAKDSFKSGLNPLSGFKEASKWAKGGKLLGAAGSISSIWMNVKESFLDDETSTTGQKIRNFAVNQTVDTVSDAGAAYAGAAIGTMIGGPLGTVIGAGAGIAISAFLDYKWGGEKGSSIKDMTKDALKGATNAIGDGFKTVAGWFS